jgi:hypothetical protein
VSQPINRPTDRNSHWKGSTKMMICKLLIGATATAMFAASTAYAAPVLIYSGDALPTASTPAFDTFFLETGSTQSPSGGVLSVATDEGEFLENRLADYSAFAPSNAGTVIEARLRTSVVGPTGFAGGMLVATGGRLWNFAIGASFLTDLTGTSGGDGFIPAPSLTEFRTFTFVIPQDTTAGGAPLTAYVDGVQVTDALGAPKSYQGDVSGTLRLAFGDLSNAETGTVEWDYITANTAGVPEPTTLAALASVGGLAALRRRRVSR